MDKTTSIVYHITMNDTYTAFRCPLDLLAKAKVKAERDRRSLSKYIILLIEKDIADEPMPKKTVKKKR